jgi:SAM-dependent methyltransferase
MGRLRPKETAVRPRSSPPIRSSTAGVGTDVDRYWTDHLVHSEPFKSVADSERYLAWRFEEYPLFREFSGLYGEHPGKVVLDYGCGPGHDVVGFALYSGAHRIIGVDVSPTALELAAQRVALHGVDPDRVDLLHTSDAEPALPLDDASECSTTRAIRRRSCANCTAC